MPKKKAFVKISQWSSCVAQWIKYLVLSLQWLGSLLWHGFDPWPGKFRMLQDVARKKKEEEKRKDRGKRGLHRQPI